MIRFVEDIYADFLYDCHIANQRLTDEDWEWYGREEHHIELPERDGGVLTPLNSQPLTTYQHWIAGILQSEVLGKCCFACVPKGVLPKMFETLRIKWARTHNRDVLLASKNRGKMWINDGNQNRMIRRSEPIPAGWERGRLPFSEEHRANIGNSTRGRVISEETRAKLKARPNAWVGRKHTEESKEKMRQAKLRRRAQ
jgi:hypothetical protein